ncbi:MAG: dolichyl-phosphate beta-glucosyltransferase [Nanoarchaeota archaeon]
MSQELSIVIPCYNEEKRIQATLTKILHYLRKKKLEYELIIVDDGSNDLTKEIVKRFMQRDKHIRLLTNRPNRGKGYSVKRGMLAARKSLVLFSDADLSTPIEELDKFLPLAQDYDIIIASRNLKTSHIQTRQPFYRILAGKMFPLFVRLFLVQGIKDTQCGFKMFKRKIIPELFKKQQLQGWAFDAELLYIARKKGYRIKEVGVRWLNDPNSKVRLVRDSLRMFKDILKIRLNELKGRYD